MTEKKTPAEGEDAVVLVEAVPAHAVPDVHALLGQLVHAIGVGVDVDGELVGVVNLGPVAPASVQVDFAVLVLLSKRAGVRGDVAQVLVGVDGAPFVGVPVVAEDAVGVEAVLVDLVAVAVDAGGFVTFAD